MEIKEYARLKDGRIVKPYNKKCYHCKEGFEIIKKKDKGVTFLECIKFDEVFKTTNEPKELIEIFDLVEVTSHKDTLIVEVGEVYGDEIYARGAGYELEFHIDNVVAILTPNVNGTQYTTQWVKE